MSRAFKTPRQVIYVCNGSKCKKRGGKDLCKLFRNEAKSVGLKDQVEIIKTDCTDRCKQAPIVSFQPQNLWLQEVTEYEAKVVFQQQIASKSSSNFGADIPKNENPSNPEA